MGEPSAGQESQQRCELFAAVAASAHDAIVVVDTKARIMFWNPEAERLFGYSAARVLDRSLDLLLPADSRADQREMLDLVAAGARLDRFRTSWLHCRGQPVHLSVAVSPVADPTGRMIGLTFICRPVSSRERTEASFQALLEAAPDAVVGVNDNGRVVLSNTQAERLFGLARHGLIGKNFTTLVSPTPWSDAPQRLDSAGPTAQQGPTAQAGPTGQTGPVAQAVMTAHRSDATTVPVEITTSMLETDQGPIRCAVIRDITDRLHAQDEYLRMRTEAERARLEAQLQRTQRLESLGHLAGGVAHDFNNLIAVIVNYASFIAEAAHEAGLTEIARDAEQISRAGQRGADLTHQLLAFARREVIRPRPLDLNKVIDGVEQMLRRSIGEHITLIVRSADWLPAITADPGQLEQILVNLAVNARDAMPTGGQLTIETAAIDVDAHYASTRPHLNPGRYVRLRISDTGSGMPPEVIAQACEPFFTTKPPGQGTGLGLATVYGIVTAAGGDLSIYSETGMGTTITIVLPATDEPPVPLDDTDNEPPTGTAAATILAVDDEAGLRDVVQRILTQAGHHVVTAPDGPTALTIAATHQGPIDILLTDVVMPHMLGKELAQRFSVLHPNACVLYMSGYAQPVLASQGTLDPDVTLIEKPFTKTQLITAVHHCLEHRGKTPPSTKPPS